MCVLLWFTWQRVRDTVQKTPLLEFPIKYIYSHLSFTKKRVTTVHYVIAASVAAFDCFGKSSSCAESHVSCDIGYGPYCEHFPGPGGEAFGICTCDKGEFKTRANIVNSSCMSKWK